MELTEYIEQEITKQIDKIKLELSAINSKLDTKQDIKEGEL